MEKQELIVSYSGSGVRTLRGFGVFFFITGAVALFIALIGGINGYSSDNVTALTGVTLSGTFIQLGLILLFFGAVCAGLTGIAKTALYRRMIIEEQYEIFVINKQLLNSLCSSIESCREDGNRDKEIELTKTAIEIFSREIKYRDDASNWKRRLEQLQDGN
ncbi:MAG: hypothetical protein LBH60_04255 [Prevotellaceae bacterium]|jgi:hypothetical protein|nr:hypothetical protein [Prevotellaceae bacterium]